MAGQPTPYIIQKNYGGLPIMVMSRGCHLADSTDHNLMAKKEESGVSC